jgi:ATP-dependent exoDNAse (exonuclease V) alpha subunit
VCWAARAERTAVVLFINDGRDRDRARERLYVGISRATDVLVVVGDPSVVRRIGGDNVAKRLGLTLRDPSRYAPVRQFHRSTSLEPSGT